MKPYSKMTSYFRPPAPLQTAVLFLVFNRPDTTAQVFDAIRQAKPPRLYVAADGPRGGREGEAEQVAKVREISTAIDWPCELKTLFRQENLGCKSAVSNAINWFFEQEEQGIILEDDCLPSQSFFWFCEGLLVFYKEDSRIMKIAGYNILSNIYDYDYDYIITHFSFAWGWASWRRAWKKFDVEMSDWPSARESFISKTHPFIMRSVDIFEKTYNGEIDTWDYQWEYAIAKNYAFSLVPKRSLISNIGFGEDATHTFGDGGERAKVKASEIRFPLKHPEFIFRNSEYEHLLLNFLKKEKFLALKIARKWFNLLTEVKDYMLRGDG